MKMKMFLPVIFVVLSVAACAQPIDVSKVPAPVKSAFAKQFPGINAKWSKEGKEYEANFKNNGTDASASFDADGKWLETETDMKASELPSAITAYIKAHYPGAKISEAALITKANGEINYEAEVKGKDLIFDKAGNFIKK